jgi:hypothetical protein
MRVELAPFEVAPPRVRTEDDEPLDPLDDPATYGRVDGGVPGYRRQPVEDDE